MAIFDYLERVTTSPTIFLAVSATVLLTAYVLVHTYSRRVPANAPVVVSDDFPLTGAIRFWTKRWEWYRQARHRSQTGNFSFHAGPNTIVGLSGEKGRKLFFESKELAFSEGYAVMFGSTPNMKEVAKDVVEPEDVGNYFSRRLNSLLKSNIFSKKLSVLKSDVQEAIEAINNDPTGATNPFESIYRIVFRLTIRMVGCEELADNPVLLETFLKYFEMIDQSATAAAVMFPKIPSPAILRRTYAGARLYMMIEGFVKKRAETGEKHDDALQFLLEQGDKTFNIIQFMVGALFAGLLNSGINAGYVLCFLATSPEWLAKAREEVRATAAKYATNPNASLRDQLDDIPLEAWEAEFPVIDTCLRESIRLNTLGTGFRRNTTGKPIPTGNGNEVIPNGAFVTYAIYDVHFDPNIYSEPEKWDPSRYSPERGEDKKGVYPFVGWGASRHPCLGMRFAKLENNLITAYFLASFDFHLQDKNGNNLSQVPTIDVNGASAHKPKNPLLLKVSPREK